MMDYLKIVLPILATLITALWGIIKYFKERTLKTYSESIKSLFSDDKKVVLSTIATLDFFKNKKSYKNNVIDILVNRLYTELDYEIVNAIITELSQVSNEKEFKYISQKLLDINRNFELQSSQINKRYETLNKANKEIYERYDQIPIEDKIKDEELKFIIESKRITRSYEVLSKYQLNWHKQIVGEAFAMLLLEANRKKITENLDLKLFENNMSGTHLFNFRLNNLRLLYAAFKDASLQELFVKNIQFEHAFFENAIIRRCAFNGGKISNAEFVNTKLDWITFDNIEFEDVYFIGVEFNKCTFTNVKGINKKLFFNCRIISDCKVIESNFTFENLNNTKKGIKDTLDKSNRSIWGRRYIKRKLEEQ